MNYDMVLRLYWEEALNGETPALDSGVTVYVIIIGAVSTHNKC